MRWAQLHGALLVLCIAVSYQAGCEPPVTVGRHENVAAGAIDRIVILPVADGRRQVKGGASFEKRTAGVQAEIAGCLREKGYECQEVADPDALGTLSPGQVPFAEPAQIRKIGPNEARWVLVPVVDAIDPSVRTFYAVSCYLFDKQSGKLVWEGNGRNAGIHDVVQSLLKEFPEKSM